MTSSLELREPFNQVLVHLLRLKGHIDVELIAKAQDGTLVMEKGDIEHLVEALKKLYPVLLKRSFLVPKLSWSLLSHSHLSRDLVAVLAPNTPHTALDVEFLIIAEKKARGVVILQARPYN